MRLTVFERLTTPLLAASLCLAAVPAHGQDAVAPEAARAPSGAILSSAISVSEREAALDLELAEDRSLTLTLDEDGAVRLNGERIGGYQSGSAFERSWRALLDRSISLPSDELRAALIAWEPTDDPVAERVDRELEAMLSGTGAPVRNIRSGQVPGDARDTIGRLNDRLRQLEQELQALEGEGIDIGISAREIRREVEREIRRELERELRHARGGSWSSPFRHLIRGISGIFSTLMAYAILVGLGFGLVFFGRDYLETVADTARNATIQAGLVGLAGSFLLLPAFILGIIALAISIVGIPLLLVWVPLFPVAVLLAAVGGYLAVAHGAGEALAERRFVGGDWFKRANSYYYVLTGVGLLLVFYLGSHIVQMAGPWLGFLQGLLYFLAVVVTWAAFTIGFGAVLLSRAGTRKHRANGAADADAPAGFEEETHV